jgi:hypothetical protein
MLEKLRPLVRPPPPPSLHPLAAVLNLTAASWTAANKEARATHRRARSGRGQKKRCGFGSGGWRERDGWTATSATTDGIALCVTLSRPRSSLERERPQKECVGDNACTQSIAAFAAAGDVAVGALHLVTHDPGRSNLFQAVQKTTDDTFVAHRLTRHEYRASTLQTRREAEETRRRASRPELTAALSVLSGGTYRTTRLQDFVTMVDLNVGVHQVLVDEYVTDSWYASWKMLLWRRRRSVLMQRYVKVLKAVAPSGSSTVYGVGSAGFSSSGPGETSVPTVGSRRALCLAARSLCTDRRVHVCPVGEARTTMCCYRCHSVLRDVYNDEGRALRGLKQCINCTPDNTPYWTRLVHVHLAALELPCAEAPACDACEPYQDVAPEAQFCRFAATFHTCTTTREKGCEG